MNIKIDFKKSLIFDKFEFYEYRLIFHYGYSSENVFSWFLNNMVQYF